MAQQYGEEGRRAERAQAPDIASPTAANSYKVAVRRNGTSVEITLTSADDYASMQLYDSLIQSARNGCLRLEVSLARP